MLMSVSTPINILSINNPSIHLRQGTILQVKNVSAKKRHDSQTNFNGTSLPSFDTGISHEGSAKEEIVTGDCICSTECPEKDIYTARQVSCSPSPSLSDAFVADLLSSEDGPFSCGETVLLPDDLPTSDSTDSVYSLLQRKTEFKNLPHLEVLISKPDAQNKKRPSFQRSFSTPVTATWNNIRPEVKKTSQKVHCFLNSHSVGKVVTKCHFCTEDKFTTTNVQSKLLTKLVQSKSDSENQAAPEFIIKSQNLCPHRQQSDKRATVTSTDICEDTDNNSQEDTSDFEEINTAMQKSISEGSMMPILKKELQTKLQYERLLRGDPELVLEKETPKQYELRPDEVEKRDRRLSQNRESARRCRLKLETRKQSIKKVIKQEMRLHAKLQKEIEQLKRERNTLGTFIEKHKKYCSLTFKKSTY